MAAIVDLERDGMPLIGDWLMKNRIARGLSQQKLANELGVNRNIIADLEYERCRPKKKVMTALLCFFNQ
jgi:DNA-binding XRE family transcriptional regulator